MKLIRKNFPLILIIILAAIFRLYQLSSVPVGFNDDEAAFGYNAYSILKTGKDEWARFLPFPTFESFGDWKLVFYLYLTVLSQLLFGINEFATRLPSVAVGIGAVATTYFLAKELFLLNSQYSDRGKKVGIIAAILLAISPWHIIASRNAFESDLLIFFITLACYFFIKGFKNKKHLTASFMVFALAFYVYRSSWIFVPLFVSMLIFFNRDYLQKFKKYLVRNIIFTVVILTPLIPTVLTFKGQSRFIQESFITGISRQGIINEINERRGVCKQNLPKTLCALLYNKYYYFTKTYIGNYFNNLSYQAYFEDAIPTGFQSFATREVFHLFELPFLAVGIFFLLKQKEPAARFLIPWLILAPIGASIAGVANYGRMNIIMSAPQIIAAFGLYSLYSLIAPKNLRRTFFLIIIFTLIFSSTKLFVDLFYIEPGVVSRYQRYGYKELFAYLASKEDSFNSFYISRKIDNSHQYIQYLYFQKIDPNYFFNNVKRSRGENGWIELQNIGNYFFISSIPDIIDLPPKSLLVVGEKEMPSKITAKLGPSFVINDLRGDRLFEVYEVDKLKQELKEGKLE